MASRILAAKLPEDLQTSASQVLADLAKGLEECQETIILQELFWQYKICASLQLRLAARQISALEATTVAPQPE